MNLLFCTKWRTISLKSTVKSINWSLFWLLIMIERRSLCMYYWCKVLGIWLYFLIWILNLNRPFEIIMNIHIVISILWWLDVMCIFWRLFVVIKGIRIQIIYFFIYTVSMICLYLFTGMMSSLGLLLILFWIWLRTGIQLFFSIFMKYLCFLFKPKIEVTLFLR